MTKNDLAKTVAGRTGMSQTAASEALGAVLESIEAELASGGEVAITGFGRFSVAERSARQGVNPATGERISIPATTAPKFTAGAKLKSAVRS
ncbi:MAG TPA: HU family DNA-binding protein [Solirubrobacteraceae bacterium]|nr:HU family DNA-binding protein [Solirubrobacteraceae bacterium]